MKERSFDEMIAYFNRRVSEMDISQDRKMELLGMVTALGYKHEKSVPQWIPCKTRLPEESGTYLVSGKWGSGKADVGDCVYYKEDGYFDTAWNFDVLAWMPLPESYKGEKE